MFNEGSDFPLPSPKQIDNEKLFENIAIHTSHHNRVVQKKTRFEKDDEKRI